VLSCSLWHSGGKTSRTYVDILSRLCFFELAPITDGLYKNLINKAIGYDSVYYQLLMGHKLVGDIKIFKGWREFCFLFRVGILFTHIFSEPIIELNNMPYSPAFAISNYFIR